MIIVNTDWFFLSHRLPLASAAAAAGADVTVVATDTGRADEITAAGLRFVDARMSRMGRQPLRELGTLFRLTYVIRRQRPDLLHLVATKSVIYGGIAAIFARRPAVVSAVTGAGYALSPERRGPVQRLVRLLLRMVLGRARAVVFQHEADRDAYLDAGLVDRGRTHLVRGVGVDPEAWRVGPEPADPVVLLAARLIEEKGVITFVEASSQIRQSRSDVKFVLVGQLEPDVPTGIDREQLAAWEADGLVEWWGHRKDMPTVLAACQVFVLPTYHNEGVPKVLLEAGAAARAVIASDIAGCRTVIADGRTGVLVPPRDPARLADAITKLLDHPATRARLATSLREVVAEHFTERDLTAQSLEVYRAALSTSDPCVA